MHCNANFTLRKVRTFYTKHFFFNSCICPIGLKGDRCDMIDNPCDKSPCKNNAECQPTMLRDPKNLTNLEEKFFDEFKCNCPPFFYGDRCELFTTPDFMFDFEKSSVNNYVKLSGPSNDLTAISFCAWIQTNDLFNYGSIVSYATNEIDNAFTFTDYHGFVLYVNGINAITDIKIIDNIWHFLCGKIFFNKINISFIKIAPQFLGQWMKDITRSTWMDR